MTSPADVIVIGGGVIGSAVAYSLARRGANVTLLDASTPGRATSASAGGLWPLGESLGLGCGVIFHGTAGGVPEPLPRDFMDFLCASNRMFPQLAEELRACSGVDIEAETGTGLLYLLYDASQETHARRIVEHLRGTSQSVELWSADDVARHDPSVTRDVRGAVYFPGDNQVNPMLLAEGLKRAAVAKGARFVAEARVRRLSMDGARIASVETDGDSFACGSVVNAAGAWGAEIARMAGAEIPIVPIRGQILCTETLAPGTLRSNLSTRDCYLLQKAHGEVIVGSTTERSDFDAAVRPQDMRSLAAGAVRAVPALAGVSLKRAWAGLRPGTPDELPILGADDRSPNLFHATGGFRTGIVAAPLTGEVVAACVLGEAPPTPVEPFLASRFCAVR